MSEILTSPLIAVLSGCIVIFTVITVFSKNFLMTRKRYMYFFLMTVIFIVFQILISGLYALGISVNFILSMFIFFGGISLYVIYFFRRNVYKTIKNTGTSPLRSLPMGFCETSGTVEMIDSSEKILFYCTPEEGNLETLKTNGRWFVALAPFILRSEGTRIFVDVEGVTFHFKNKVMSLGREFSPIKNDNHYLHYQKVDEGDEIFCIGTVEKYSGGNNLIEKLYKKNSMTGEKPEIVIKKGNLKPMFIISDMKEEELLENISKNDKNFLTLATGITLLSAGFYSCLSFTGEIIEFALLNTLVLSWAFLIPALIGIYFYLVKYY